MNILLVIQQIRGNERLRYFFIAGWRPPKDLLPYRRGFHAHVQRDLSSGLFEPTGEGAVYLDAQGLKRPPFAVSAEDLFAREQAGLRKPLTHGSAQSRCEAQAAQTDPGHAARIDGRE